LDALLYARRYRDEVSALVLVDSPSESAPAPPGGALSDGATRLDFRAGLQELRGARGLSDLPVVVLSHGRRTFSTPAAERSWARMQQELTSESSRSIHVVALKSRHLIQVDQPALVAEAVEQATSGTSPRCVPAYAADGGQCATSGKR
jgi:pimeloyl-ACP methyl ester carboxylesterase